MKTQINELIKGDHRKGIVGTNYNKRNIISQKVIAENPKKLKIQIRGCIIGLTANWSVSKKSVHYAGSIPVELYKSFFGDFGLPKEKPEAYIIITNDMFVELSTNSKKIMWQNISAKEVTIL